MKTKIPLNISSLSSLINALSIAIVTTGCTMVAGPEQVPVVDDEPEPIRTITIDHELANELIADTARELYTDFGDPLQCLWSIEQPSVHEPVAIAAPNIWQTIRTGMTLDHQFAHRRIDAQFRWYKNHPSYMARVSKRAERYIYYITKQLIAREMPLELALLPIVESAYDPFAYSHGRASGMWQFIPSTARHFKLQQNWWYDGRRDIVASTDAALTYLSSLHKRFDNDWLLALAAYNSGQGTVAKAIAKNRRRGKPTDYWSLDLPRETKSYVPKLLALAKLINQPQRYGISLHPIPNQPYFAAVDIQSQIDLAQAAQLAQLDIDEIYRLNPGFNRWATPPSGPHRLLVPVANQEVFEHQLAEHPPQQRLLWTRYTVRQGDSLLSLAARFNTSAELIRQSNNIRGNLIRVGQSLMIAQASNSADHYTLSAKQRLKAKQQTPRGKANKQLFHTVKAGDSLWSIAKRYRVKVASLAKWNAMAPKDTLRLGQKLSVWTKAPLTHAPRASTRDAVVRKVGYRVRKGDSLARIAQRFNLRIKDITTWNPVNRKAYLQPGQQLTLYVNITDAFN